MDSLEVSYGILEIIASGNNFDELSFEERREKVLESFEMIYSRVRQIKTEVTLTDLSSKVDRIGDLYRHVSSLENLRLEDTEIIRSTIGSDVMSCTR